MQNEIRGRGDLPGNPGPHDQPRTRSERRSLGDAQAWLAAIIDSAEDAIVGKDLDGIVRSWNRSAERIFGYSAEEMIGTNIRRLIPDDLQHEEDQILASIRAGKRIDHYETTRQRKDGRFIHVSLTISPVMTADGTIVGASKIARDVSELRESERSAAHLAAIVESSDDAIISKDLRGIVRSWNPAAERLYGFRADEMVGRSIMRVIPPELAHDEERLLGEIRGGKRIEHYETTRLHKDGRRLDVSITVSPVRDRSGRIVGASKIARDVSGQREAQRKKDEFLAVLAHELRNPMAPIRNAIALFRIPGLDEAQRGRALGIAERQMAHMARLLDDLLDVTRLTTGRVELQRQQVDLGQLVRDAVDATRALIEARGHALNVKLPAQKIPLDADPVRITQVFTNLLTNAAKYTEPGGRIEIAATRHGAEAVVDVTDTGIGFAPEMREHLFKLFSQDQSAMSFAAGGLGIGLALVKEFVERHGGSVDAASPGLRKGSRFTVHLPVAA